MVRIATIVSLLAAAPAMAAEQNPGLATLEALQSSCEGAKAEACEELARRYGVGEGVPRDMARAARLFRTACEAGRASGCVGLAAAHIDGDGIAKPSLVRAAELLESACDRALGNACYLLAVLYGLAADDPSSAMELRRDPGSITARLERSCELGSVDGCIAIATDRPRSRHAPEAIGPSRRLLERAVAVVSGQCEAPDAEACLTLGQLYGPSLKADPVLARAAKARGRKLLADACGAGHLGQNGCTGLGEMYLEFRGDADEPASAEAPLARACAGKYVQACWGLARLSTFYRNGELVPKDQARALDLARRACAVSEPCQIPALRLQLKAEEKPVDPPLVDPPFPQR